MFYFIDSDSILTCSSDDESSSLEFNKVRNVVNINFTFCALHCNCFLYITLIVPGREQLSRGFSRIACTTCLISSFALTRRPSFPLSVYNIHTHQKIKKNQLFTLSTIKYSSVVAPVRSGSVLLSLLLKVVSYAIVFLIDHLRLSTMKCAGLLSFLAVHISTMRMRLSGLSPPSG